MATLYDELGVRPDVAPHELREAYRREARRRHPDMHPGAESAAEDSMRRLNAAWAILGDPESRRAYDSSLPGTRGPGAGGLDGARRGGASGGAATVTIPDLVPRAHGVRLLLWPLLLVVLVVIFVFTAYASPSHAPAPRTTTSASCVSSVPGVEVYVPCDEPNVGHLVSEVRPDQPCPAGSFRHQFTSRPAVACVSRSG